MLTDSLHAYGECDSGYGTEFCPTPDEDETMFWFNRPPTAVDGGEESNCTVAKDV